MQASNKLFGYVVASAIITLLCVLVVLFHSTTMPTVGAAPVVVDTPAMVFPYKGGGDCYAAWTSSHTYSKDQNTDHCTYGTIGTMRKAVVVVAQVVVSAPSNVEDTQPIVIVTPIVMDTPIVVVVDVPTQETTKHCNKGEGNGGEGCDPGKNPEKGNNDEDQGKNKKDK